MTPETGGIWQYAAQWGAVAFIFILFLVLLYRLADKWLGVVVTHHVETSKANIQTQQQISTSMQQINTSMQQMAEAQAGNMREVLLAVKVVIKDVAGLKADIEEVLNGRKNKA